MSATMLFDNLITFSRGSNATLTGPTGLIQWAPMNLLTYSEQFDNAAWTKDGATITANTTTAPDGTSSADKLVETAITGAHRAWQAPTTAAAAHTFTVYLKAAERSFALVYAGVTNVGVMVNLSTGATTTVAGITAPTASSATAIGSGWYRCSMTFTATAAASSVFVYAASDATTYSYTGDGTSGIYVWGAQLELGTTATTYNSTTTKNLLGYSEAFDNAAWQKSNASIVAGAAANPVNGLFNAQKLMEDTATGLHYVAQSNSVTGSFTYSVYAKAKELSTVSFARASDSSQLRFDLANGVILQTGVAWSNGTIVSVGGGWYRCSGTVSLTASWVYISPRNANPYTGDGNSGVYIWGAQLSDSGSLDPYVPTPGAAPTSAAYYGPRFDYDPVTLAPKGLLVEEARTNLLVQSNSFSTTWSGPPSTGTLTSAAAISPDGTTNAWLFVPSTGLVNHDLNQTVTASAVTYTLSVYAKAQGYNFICMTYFDGTTDRQAYFNVSTGVVGTTTGAPTTAITPVGNGWYRCAITFTGVVASNQFNIGVAPSNGGRGAAGNGTSGAYLYGAQLEAGAFATSYIPTVASTVTRSADVATLTGSNFVPWYNQNAGTFVAVVGTLGDILSSYAFAVRDAGLTNTVGVDIDAAGTLRLRVTDNSVNQALVSMVTTAATNTVYDVAGAYSANDFAAVANGGTVSTDTAGTVPTNNTFFAIGSASTTGSSSFNGHIRSVTYYPDRLSNTQLQSLTT